MKPTIYFAGKISKRDDWRRAILVLDINRTQARLFDPLYREDEGLYFNGGPFFISACGHVGTHSNPGNHGAPENHDAIWQVNHERLKRADLIFAYINEADCFGTFIELGMAQTLGKKIVVCFGPDTEPLVDDLWMTEQRALRVYHGTAAQAWRQFISDFSTLSCVPLRNTEEAIFAGAFKAEEEDSEPSKTFERKHAI